MNEKIRSTMYYILGLIRALEVSIRNAYLFGTVFD